MKSALGKNMKTQHTLGTTGCLNMAIGRLRTPCVARLLALLLLLTLPDAVQAQWNYTTNNGTITITRYTGTNIAVVVPSTTNGLPVTSIGDNAFRGWTGPKGNTLPTTVMLPNTITNIGNYAFYGCSKLPCITIPDSVTNIGDFAFSYCSQMTNANLGNGITSIAFETFYYCTQLQNVGLGSNLNNIGIQAFMDCSSLAKVTIPDSVTCIQFGAFRSCSSLTQILIPGSVTTIESGAFYACASLTNVTVPNTVSRIGSSVFSNSGLVRVTVLNPMVSDVEFVGCGGLISVTIGSSVTNIGVDAFSLCSNLIGIYCMGNSPGYSSDITAAKATVYYLPGTTNWGPTFAGRPTRLWNPSIQTDANSFGIQTNCFRFNITGNTNIPIVVEACTNLAAAGWVSLQSCNLTNGSLYFSDPDWTNYPARLYRIRWP